MLKRSGGGGARSRNGAGAGAARAQRRRNADEPAGLRADRFRFLAITPCERPDLGLARAWCRRQAAAAVDLGRDPAAWPELLAALDAGHCDGLGLRIPDGVPLPARAPPATLAFLIVDGDADLGAIPAAWRQLPRLVQVCSVAEAERALAAGVAGLIAKGQESGGRVGEESSFVLLQRVLALAEAQAAGRGAVPVWCQGGIGLHTAAGAVAGGAFGVVVDSILAGLAESALSADIKSSLLALDGSEARRIAGYHVCLPGGRGGTLRDSAGFDALDAAAVRAALGGKGPAECPALLSIGQDASLARAAAADCGNVEALVNTLHMRVAGQIRQAQRLRPLDEHGAWARAHGLRYPVAQGPMTRVSDTAEFAAAVADNGGLPFLALSVMAPDAARDLLRATRERIGDRPWGVGVLGFAEPAILEPHLALVKEFKPSVLLLAGGRPSQARPFVEMGIPTYLHVPSPALLENFLKDGATHFVFEGRECGGHVGPRYSLVLWEQMLAVLSKAEAPQRLHLLFAGGIHDARSAAMVAAIAAPLAARGAKIGVLMGTAYIATREAVSSGSVLQDYQDKVLCGEHTALVETAPGHAIRCLPSQFVGSFHAEKQRLQRDGVTGAEAWKALESYTVGRLRIATKGLDYVNGMLAPVEAARRDAEGLFMIGQAVAMTRRPTTIAELHRRVTREASDRLAGIVAPALPRAGQSQPVAIVGMACIYPGAADLEAYWADILEGRDRVREVPPQRWRAEQYYRAGVAAPDKTVSKWGGFVDDTPFDPLDYGIPPQSLSAIEPAQLLSLQVARRALDDAGYGERAFDRQTTAVIFGAEASMDLANQYNFRGLYPQYCGELPLALAQALPSLTEDSFPGVLANVIAGRIANRLGLGGVNYSVDAACASSLTAIELGVKELRAGSSDLVLAGGADFHNGICDFLLFSAVGALSPGGRCRSFDDHADGICLGEGVGVVVLKRLDDAERDGDRIYAVIDAVAGASDGRALGLTAPNQAGQQRALLRSYWQAGVLPADVGLVEAHGTGTVVGDRTELRTLTEVYNAGGALPAQAGLGSVKSQIGHTKCAAGIAGLIKAAKALYHRVLPPTQLIEKPNPGYDAAASPFRLDRDAAPWLTVDRPLRAAVSAFGFGGTNFHALLSAHPQQRAALGAQQFPAELFALRGERRDTAVATLRRLADFVAASDAPIALRDLARSAWESAAGPVQVAFVAADRAQLMQCIDAALAGRANAGVSYRSADAAPGKLAYLFAGQGSQYPGMLRELFVYFPELRSVFDAGRNYVPLIFPPTAYDDATRQRQKQALTDTHVAQPALGLVELAAFRWLHGFGVLPDMAGGHSYGELAALACAGAFDQDGLLRLSRARADALSDAAGGEPGAMAAVALGAEALQPRLAALRGVVIANRNSPEQSVISGTGAAVEAACAQLKNDGVGVRRIDAGCAFHSPHVAAAEASFATALRGQRIGALQWPVYSNVSAAPHSSDARALRRALARHLVSPVRFVEQIERMHADGARVFVEIGPKRVLTDLVRRILRDAPHTAIALDAGERGLAGMLGTLAQLAVHCAGFDAAPLFAGRAQVLDLGQPRRLPATAWLVNGGGARPLREPLRESLRPPAVVTAAAQPVMAAAALAQGAVVDGGAGSPADRALLAYLGNMREMVRAQRDALLGYLGAAGSVLPAVAATPLPLPLPSPSPALFASAAPAAAPAVADVLLDVVSQCTGYPPEHLDPDLDLEADLSIDSIKRLEVIGQLSARLGLADGSQEKDSVLEHLAPLKTLRAMIDWLEKRAATTAAAAGQAAAAAPSAEAALAHAAYGKSNGASNGSGGSHDGGMPLDRYVLRRCEAPPLGTPRIDLGGMHFLLTDDGLGLAPQLMSLLQSQGAQVELIDFLSDDALADTTAPVDGFIHLWSLNLASAVPDVKRLFALLRGPLLKNLRHLLLAGGLGGDFGVAGSGSGFSRGGGLAGFVKSVVKEFPALRAHCVDLDLAEPPERLAQYLLQELMAENALSEVAWQAGRRFALTAVPLALTASSLAALPLDADSVVLLTGGARGITALIAIALATRYRCRLEIVGRSPLTDDDETAATRGIEDPRRLRRALLAEDAARAPAEIERRLRDLLAQRDLRHTLAQLRTAGGSVEYTQLDVCDSQAFGDFIAGLYARHGRIDGVIHGAGVVEDKLVRDKTEESFGRVFDTKVSSALVLHRLIRDDVKFVVFFSSVASAFGNKGQVDYAAANDVLDKLAHSWQARISGRVLSVNWGPWAGTGMVSEALEREYRRRGIGLIAQEQGVDALLRELASTHGDAQVLLMRGTPESFGAAAARA